MNKEQKERVKKFCWDKLNKHYDGKRLEDKNQMFMFLGFLDDVLNEVEAEDLITPEDAQMVKAIRTLLTDFNSKSIVDLTGQERRYQLVHGDNGRIVDMIVRFEKQKS